MEMNKPILSSLIVISMIVVGSYLGYDKYRSIPISEHWPYLDIDGLDKSEKRDKYVFKNGTVIVNNYLIGTYSRQFNNKIEIRFSKVFRGVKKVLGKVEGKTQIILSFPSKKHKLQISKG